MVRPRGRDEPTEPPAVHPTLAAVVREQTGLPWSRARTLCAQGRVTVDGARCVDPALRIAPGQVVLVNAQAPKLRDAPLEPGAVVFVDRDLVVVDKPAGMLSVTDETETKDTVADHLRTLLRRLDAPGPDAKLGVVHRLDRETSGVMVFSRTMHAQRMLAAQFRAHDITRVYHAIAHGAVAEGRIETSLSRDRGDGLRGSHGHFRSEKHPPPASARLAITHVRPLARLRGATLVECRLETGRQHQIRIHLSERGHPLLGERVYDRDYPGTMIDAPRIMLHARTLAFTHPRTGARVSFERDPPEDFRAMVRALGGDEPARPNSQGP